MLGKSMEQRVKEYSSKFNTLFNNFVQEVITAKKSSYIKLERNRYPLYVDTVDGKINITYKSAGGEYLK